MSLIERVHGAYIANRRVERLSGTLAPLFPDGARVLDVGCGDGQLAAAIMRRRSDLRFDGVEVQTRDATEIPVEQFDGIAIPHHDNSFDAVLLVDVLHHSHDAESLLRDCSRVAKGSIVIKDHLLEGWLAHSTLRFMDQVGNRRFGVEIPCNYLTREAWLTTFGRLRLQITEWSERLKIYPQPASLLFDRSLHFTCALNTPETTTAKPKPR
jgi:SAM-dependent methyltransferase